MGRWAIWADGRWSRVMVKKLGIRDREVGGTPGVFKVDGGTGDG